MKKKKKRKVVKKRPKKHIKIKYGRVCIALIILGLTIYLFNQFVKFPIKNIYISGNTILSDQEIIDISGLTNYPSIISTENLTIKKRLEKNVFIKSAKVYKKKLKEVYIEIDENYPIFYDSSLGKTILKDKSKVDVDYTSPLLVNYVPDTIYEEFKNKMSTIDRSILNRISEIKYDPSNVDTERFLLSMNDGNYVYLTLIYFDKINNYVDILKNFENKKGVLYLDSGEYFQVYE
ncbi:MAG: FtsQ-type POTRA domain-containing protein [Bacilli bacterium]|nr:FtsQ-type POTRA domain-containing protein [Bacilli bacterium]